MKRLLAVMLSVIMIFGTVVSPAYAADLLPEEPQEAVLAESEESTVLLPEEETAEEAEAAEQEETAEEAEAAEQEETAEEAEAAEQEATAEEAAAAEQEATAEEAEAADQEATAEAAAAAEQEETAGEAEAEVPETAGEAVLSDMAEEAPEETVYEAAPPAAEHIVTGGTNQNDTLLTGYIRSQLFGAEHALPDDGSEGILFEENTAGSHLGEREAPVYEYLKKQVEKAAKEGGTTSFRIPLSVFGIEEGKTYTEADLGFPEGSHVEYDTFQSVAFEKINVNEVMVIEALVADCPFDLYWYDIEAGTTANYDDCGFTIQESGGHYSIPSYTNGPLFEMQVAADYQGSALTLSPEKAQAVQQTVAAIQNIVDENSALADYDKLDAYRAKICSLVSYNEEALEQNLPYGDPWQLIYVFDGDPSTNVVCEGYAKAFKYLCDLSSFDSPAIECILVSGTMSGGTGAGDHMWNIVKMNDFNRYLVDITNCDAGMIGADRDLFLAGTSGDPYGSYIFTCSSGDVTYEYDGVTRSRFDPMDELDISSTDYDPEANAPADYSEVDRLLASVPENLTVYEEWTVENLNNAIADIVRGYTVALQSEVDNMAVGLSNALAELQEKPADYSAIDSLLMSMDSLYEDDYTPESWAALEAARQNVEYGYGKSRQAEVDAMAQAVSDAYEALVGVHEGELTDAVDIAAGERKNAVITEGGGAVIFRFTPDEDGKYIFLSETDNEDTVCDLLNDKAAEITTNDSGCIDNNFGFAWDLEAGKTYYYRVRYYEETETGTIPVFLRKGPVITGFAAGTIEKYEIEGVETEDSFEDEETGEWTTKKWTRYYVYPEDLRDITLTTEEKTFTGASYDAVMNEFREEYQYQPECFISDSQTVLSPYIIGKVYPEEVNIDGKTFAVEVTVSASPIQEITYEPLTVFDTDGIEEESMVGMSFITWMRYAIDISGIRLSVKTEDRTFTGALPDVQDEIESALGFYPEFDDSGIQSPNAPLKEGTNAVTARLAGKEAPLTVNIIENPITSVVVDPVTVYADVHGEERSEWVSRDGKEEEISYLFYENHVASPKHIAVTAEGRTYEGTPGEVSSIIKQEFGHSGYYLVESEQSAENPWHVGDNTVVFNFAGIETEYTVHVEEAFFTSMTVEDVVVYEDQAYRTESETPGEDRTWYSEDDFRPASITVVTKKGTFSGTPYEVAVEMRETLDLDYMQTGIEDDQDENEWLVGTHTATLVFGPLKTEYQVEIKPSIIKSLSAKKKVLLNGDTHTALTIDDNGYHHTWQEYELGEPELILETTDGSIYEDELWKLQEAIAGDYGFYPEWEYEAKQYPGWGIGTHAASGRFGAADFEEEIEIIENPISSVGVTNLEVSELLKYTAYYYYWDEDAEDYMGITWDCYPETPEEISVNLKTGETISGTPEEVEKALKERYGCTIRVETETDQSWEHPWEVGKTYQATLKFGPLKAPYSVTVTESPILSMSVGDMEIWQSDVSEAAAWVSHDAGTVRYFYYQLGEASATAVTKDGEISGTVDEVCEELEEQYGIENSFEFEYEAGDEQSYLHMWQPGEHNVTLHFGGTEADFTVLVKEGPVLAITSVEDIEVLEGTKGSTSRVEWDPEKEEDVTVEYEEYYAGPRTVTVDTINGEWTGEWGEIINRIENEFGVWINSTWESEQSETVFWEPGEHTATLILGQCKKDYKVTVIENPVASIEADDVTMMEGETDEGLTERYVEGEGWVEYEFEYYDAMPRSITVRMKNGESFTGMGSAVEEWLEENYGITARVIFESEQSDLVKWEAGHTYTGTIRLGNAKTEIRVTIEKSPVKSVTAEDVILYDSDYELVEDEIWDEETQEDKEVTWKRYDPYGDSISVVIEVPGGSGEEKTYTGFSFGVREQIREEYGISLSFGWFYDEEQGPGSEWSAGTHKGTFRFGGVSTPCNIIIKKNPVRSITVPKQYRFESEAGREWYTDPETGEETVGTAYTVMPDMMTVEYEKEDGTKATVTGTPYEIRRTVIPNFDEVSRYSGELLRFREESDQSLTNVWGVGKHTAAVRCGEISAEYEVEILPDPIKNIVIEPLTVKMSQATLRKTTVEDEEGNLTEVEWNEFANEVLKPQKMTVTWNDNTTSVGSFDEIRAEMLRQFNYDGNMFCWGAKQFHSRPWGVGAHEGVLEVAGKVFDYVVNVVNEEVKPVAVTGLTLKSADGKTTGASIAIEVPATTTHTLSAVIAPANATNKKVTWKSSNPAIVKVNADGVVTGVKIGKAVITATTDDGKKTAKCTVTVLFKDVLNKNKANYPAIYSLVDRGVIAGFGGTEFRPDDQCTRAQVVLFMWRAAGKPAPKSTKLAFKDAAEIQKLAPDYAKAIAWGNEKGIVKGFNTGYFKPNDACTRAQIVLFLYRFKNQPKVKNTTMSFKDAATIKKLAPAYTNAILWAVEKKITTGYKVSGGYEFKPNQTCTRGECATFLFRALG